MKFIRPFSVKSFSVKTDGDSNPTMSGFWGVTLDFER